jgi:alpha-L-fucosidase 2
LQEWFQDFDELEPEHRHTSHLFALYPGSLIDRHSQPELAEAARKSIQRRFDYGGAKGGWSCAWAASLFARLGNGEQAYKLYKHLLVTTTSSNLFNVHPRRQGGYLFQIDGNFGGGAAFAEMVLQSPHGEIELLPAIPAAWPEGYFKGLKARGGFEVDAAWSDGALTGGQVQAAFDAPCRLRSAAPISAVTCDGQTVRFERPAEGVIEFEAQAGKSYQFRV